MLKGIPEKPLVANLAEVLFVEKANGEVIRSQARLDALAQDAFADTSADFGARKEEVVQSWVDDLRGRVS